MKKTKYIIALLVAAISFALPAQAQERILTAIGATGKTELKVANDIKNLYFANKPESKTFKITTNTTVKPRTSADWFQASINGNVVTVSVVENSDADLRSGELTLGAPDGQSKIINVTQLGTNPGFFVSTDTARVKGIDAGVVVNITSNTNLTFTGSEWITPKDATPVVGTKNYVFIAGKMQQGTRTGTLNVSDGTNSKSVVVEQNFEGFPTFIVMSDLHFGAGGAVERVTKSLQTIYENTSDVDALFFERRLNQ